MRGHREGRREGRMGRFLEHGDLRFVLLALIAEKASHGYELIKALEERTGGAYRPSPGVIYPTLSLLEDEGFVRQVGEAGGRKAYEPTEAGQEALAQNKASVDAVFARMDEAGSQSSSGSARLARAMQNLGTALRLRMQRGGVSDNVIDIIVEAIDEVAARIEKS